MSMLAFSEVADGAKEYVDLLGTGVGENTIPIKINLVLFLAEHIHLLEEQLGAAQTRIHDLERL